jgi:hypothetical protein
LSFSEKLESNTIPEMEIEVTLLSANDLDVDLLDSLGDWISRALLPLLFFETVASRRFDQIITSVRLPVHLHLTP